MTLEDRCRQMLGQLLMENMALAAKVEQLEAQVKELTPLPAETKPE